MPNRSTRRAAERAALKQARKASRTEQPPQIAADPVVAPASEPAPISDAQLAANRANAQLSTGPTSPEGKATSSQNRRTHGLAGAFCLLPWEDRTQFETLLSDLRAEYQPTTITEQTYVDRMAEHQWLRQRCLTLLPTCFDSATQSIKDEKLFALLTRYQTTNERGYDKCVNQLEKLRAARHKEQIGFESQKRLEAAESRKIEAHEARIRLMNARAEDMENESAVSQTLQVPIPGHVKYTFQELSGIFRTAMCAAYELNREQEAA
jgi:hypothetical protein